MNRRSMLGLSLGVIGSVFVPRYGRWTRQGSGLLVADDLPEIVVAESLGDVVWLSDNPRVATVDQTGLVTYLRPGRARISCMYMGVKSGPFYVTCEGVPNG